MKTYFPGVQPVRYEGADSKNPLSFKFYNPEEIVEGRSMREHLRFSVAFWHTLKGDGGDPFGLPTQSRPWDAAADPMRRAEDALRAAFEFCSRLGLDFYCFHDRDIAPEADTLRETNARLDRMLALALRLQSDTGIRLLWNTANLFSHPRYAHGAATSPDAGVFAYAAAQVKKMLEAAVELGASNYVFWGGREGYQNLLNTDMKRELDQLAAFLRMAVDYAREIGFEGQFLIEPKPKEPTRHQYDADAASVIGFLLRSGLETHFKLNIEANHATLAGHSFQHELTLASIYGLLGSVDANRGELLLGWDTDRFPLDVYETTLAMLVILGQGGLGRGGLNFDAHVRRESTDAEDLFHAHIGGMDAFALGLKAAARIRKDGRLDQLRKDRYASHAAGIGMQIAGGQIGLAELEAYALEHGEPSRVSGRQEYLENVVNQCLFG